ncbi:sodium-dependent phosphate transport protein 2B-like isoform X2 [Monodelphis domestica]|uniref:sodium-dependent phosphate transport protein 2B-like isoform X2 n=1 Tax=Monodelphis domestica TaxID=13616 RepID=UPI0024E236FF|nr:sodium-dependent phosphate transport protein 2B-like isoform X2 [Monodelphis domestica]
MPGEPQPPPGEILQQPRNKRKRVQMKRIPKVEDEECAKDDNKTMKKNMKVFFKTFLKVIHILTFLFFFICSLDILSSAFQLVAGKLAADIFFDGSILLNPIAASMVGLLVTVLVQSSSICTSIIVSLVSSSVLTVYSAIPMVMGANVGSAITNTLVALMYAGDREVFGRVFTGATIHDLFNWMTLIVLLPLELITDFLFQITESITTSFKIQADDDAPELLKILTGLITDFIIQLDKKVITEIAAGSEAAKNKSLIKIWCKTFSNVTLSNITVPSPENCTSSIRCWTEGNMTWTLRKIIFKQNITKCTHIFVNTSLSDTVVGFILLPVSLLILGASLLSFIRVLNHELKGPVAAMIKKYINIEFPYPFTWLAGYLAILVGAVLTLIVQSSSVFTSIIAPLYGIGMINLQRAYALTLGSNIGTTSTAILVALASPRNTLQDSLQIALCHFFFNIVGVILWYPIPFMRLPIHFAKKLGETTATYRWFSIVYLVIGFFLGPLMVFCFSIVSRTVLIYAGLPLFFLPFVIVYLHAFNIFHLFPLWMSSLKPWDDLITSIMVRCQWCGQTISQKCKNSKLNKFISRRLRPQSNETTDQIKTTDPEP